MGLHNEYGSGRMTTWKYEFKDYRLVLKDEPEAIIETGATRESDTILAEIDAEVHRLYLLKEKCEADIYKLRKWQKALKKENNTIKGENNDPILSR
jgi:hypothetical protein